MYQSHEDQIMFVWPPYHVSLLESAGASVYCCILFYTFEVPFQSKLCSCTFLVHKCQKIHKDHKATIRCLHSLHMEATQALCIIFLSTATETAQWLNNLSMISAWFPTTSLHQFIVETSERNIKCKQCVIRRSHIWCLNIRTENRRQINCMAPGAIVILTHTIVIRVCFYLFPHKNPMLWTWIVICYIPRKCLQ